MGVHHTHLGRCWALLPALPRVHACTIRVSLQGARTTLVVTNASCCGATCHLP